MEPLNSPVISIIVPVYNAECFITECIESIVGQDYKDLQIILIDDGSTDSSGIICDEYAKKDERICVIHQKNSGVSSARNRGLKIAIGKYVAFVDADDVLPKYAYSYLMKNDTSSETLIMGQRQLMSEQGELLTRANIRTAEISKIDFIMDLFTEAIFPYLGYLTDKLFLRDIIHTNNIWFDKNVKLNEDRLFVLEYTKHCKRIKIMEGIVYYYRQRKSGVIASTRRNKTVTDEEMTVLISFQRMQSICFTISEEAYYICSRKAFESALDLLRRVSPKDKEKKKSIKEFLVENSRICMKNPNNKLVEKIKIIGHTILER